MASSFKLRQKHNLGTVRAVGNYLGNRHRFKVLVGYEYSHAMNGFKQVQIVYQEAKCY